MDKAKGELADAIKKVNGGEYVTVSKADFGDALSSSAAGIICSEFYDAPDELKNALVYLSALIAGLAWCFLTGELKEEDFIP